jgi:hypothetical protein
MPGSKSDWFSGEIDMAKRYEHLHCKHRGDEEVCGALLRAELSSAKACEEQKSERGRACLTDDECSAQRAILRHQLHLHTPWTDLLRL